MSGKAILILVAGIIIITATIMYNIEANSTKLVGNFHDYFMRQTTQNIAQSGVNMAMNQLSHDVTWRMGFTAVPVNDSRVTVDLAETVFDGLPVIRIRSIGETDYSATRKRRDTTIAYAFLTQPIYPVNAFGLVTLRANTSVNGNITIDGRDWNTDGTMNLASGVPGVWSTAPTFDVGGSYQMGGTVSGIDYAPARPPNPNCFLLNQIHPGVYPTTPDAVFGGTSSYFPEGTLKAMAQTGLGGSQYVTDVKNLKLPLGGVTYIEVPPGTVVQPPKISGSGILVIRSSDGTSNTKGLEGRFDGIAIFDKFEHLHADFYGSIFGLADSQPEAVLGNGSAVVRFSRQAIMAAQVFMVKNGAPQIVAWWE